VARSLALTRPFAIRAAIFAGGLVCGVGFATLTFVRIEHRQSPSLGSTPARPSVYAVPATPARVPTLSPDARAAVDERINELQSRLGITPAQMPLWSAFTAAMRDNAATTQALFARRATALATMSAIANMHSYAEIARAYADDTQRLAAAFDRLYARLSDAQKQAADALFREQTVAAARPR
jgi:periplasmic protein CpxP/Spy